MVKPARVLMISNDPSLFDEGSETRSRLRAYASNLEVLHVLSRGGKGVVTDGNLILHGVSAFKLFAPLVLVKQAQEIITDEKIQVVSAQDPFEHGWAAARAARAAGSKLHIQIHTDFLSPYFVRESLINKIRVHLADKVLPQAQGIRVVSERIAKSLTARYGTSIIPLVVLPIAIPNHDDEAALPLPAELPSFRVIAVGRLTTEKRFEDVLRALALSRVHTHEHGAGLVIVGDGPKRSSLEALARSLGLSDVVRFMGARKDARALVKSATAFIQASSYEGYGRTILEAALAHIPIITTDVGIVGEVLRPGVDVLVCPVGDINCLSEQIKRLVSDNAFRSQLAQNCARRSYL
jgi:glycosyltransferase involved in cell wall biosynthesis